MKKKRLEREQAAMRFRNGVVEEPKPVDTDLVQRRVLAHVLIEYRRWPLTKVAEHLKVSLESLTKWERQGRPVLPRESWEDNVWLADLEDKVF